MAFTLMVHVILVPLGVALPFITLLMNYLGLRRKDAVAFQLARRWSTVMAIQFAIGVVTGTVISLEFGLLWPGLMGRWGDVFGTGFGIEAWAFFLEAILISIYLYGWKRLSPQDPLPAGAADPVDLPAGRVRDPVGERVDEHAAGLHPRLGREPDRGHRREGAVQPDVRPRSTGTSSRPRT